MACDSSANLHVVYYGDNGYIYYQKYNGSSWSGETAIIGDASHLAYNPCISIDQSNNIYVSAEVTGYYSSSIRSIVANIYSGGSWQGVQQMYVQQYQNQHACLLWAEFPYVSPGRPNILQNNAAMIWIYSSGGTGLEYSGMQEFMYFNQSV